jgi:imidazole glycerol-phosphate synthase subunit HisH
VTADVTIVRTGTANVASVLAALHRLGASASFVAAPDDVRTARRLVLPGVGSFAHAVGEIDRQGLRAALCERLADGRATLAICLGMQLLAERSEEGPGARGLGIVPGAVVRLPSTVAVPQLGWNLVQPDGAGPIAAGAAYFAHGYCLTAAPAGWHTARTEHGIPFVSAMARGRVLACQFHPEISGDYGERLLRGWLADDARAPAETSS